MQPPRWSGFARPQAVHRLHALSRGLEALYFALLCSAPARSSPRSGCGRRGRASALCAARPVVFV
eukprot:1325211-Alexandrium_andersonii.AAC.1